MGAVEWLGAVAWLGLADCFWGWLIVFWVGCSVWFWGFVFHFFGDYVILNLVVTSGGADIAGLRILRTGVKRCQIQVF